MRQPSDASYVPQTAASCAQPRNSVVPDICSRMGCLGQVILSCIIRGCFTLQADLLCVKIRLNGKKGGKSRVEGTFRLFSARRIWSLITRLQSTRL